MPRSSRLPGAGMMGRVGAAPAVVGRQRQDAERAADPVVGIAIGEEGAMAAIVLDHEDTHQEAGRRKDEDQTPPMAIGIGGRGQRPERGERNKGDGEFEGAASPVRLLVARQIFNQARLLLAAASGEIMFIRKHRRGIPCRKAADHAKLLCVIVARQPSPVNRVQRTCRPASAAVTQATSFHPVQPVEQFPEAVGNVGLDTESRQGAQKARHRLGAELAPDFGGELFSPFRHCCGSSFQNPVSASKLLQQGNGSRITLPWQAKPASTVKFELKSKDLH